MRLSKPLTAIDAHVQFSGEDVGEKTTVGKPAVVFGGDDRISGTATFKLRKEYVGVRYRLMVTGVVETTTSEYPPGGMNPGSKVDTHTFLSAAICDNEAKDALPVEGRSKHEVQIPFVFSLHKLDDVLARSTSRGGAGSIAQQVLPSVDSKAAMRGRLAETFKASSSVQYKINYSVVASAYLDGKLAASSARPFGYTPTSAPSPPIAIEDFPEEYAVRKTTDIRKSSAAALRVGVVGGEPPALVLRMNGDSGKTDLSLLLMLFQNAAQPSDSIQLPSQCRIKAHLRLVTFVMPRGSRSGMHTLQAVEYDRESTMKQEKGFFQEYTMALKDWVSHVSHAKDEKGSYDEMVSSQSISFPFRVNGDQMPCPTFYSPLLSRRYAIDLTFDFDGVPNSTTKLRLPLQIVYEQAGE